MNQTVIRLLVVAVWVTLVSCSGGKMEQPKNPYTSLKSVPPAAWKQLRQKRIFFGHQSVGGNIVDGIRALAEENGNIRLNVVGGIEKDTADTGVFRHAKVGCNKDPQSKIDAFVQVLDQQLPGNVDMAFLKFCYVDVRSRTDIQHVFQEYVQAVDGLRGRHPQTTFLHFTIPLKKNKPQTFITWIKGLIGRDVDLGIDDNIRRNEMNQLIREKYQKDTRLFDIARIESTMPDGTRSVFRKDDRTYFELAGLYTDDGGHLNEKGRKLVASRLLLFLLNHM